MLKAWRAHQAEVQRRAEAGEPPLKTIEDFRVEVPDVLPDAPDATEPDPKAADSTECGVQRRMRKIRDSCMVQETGGASGTGVGEERAAKVRRVDRTAPA